MDDDDDDDEGNEAVIKECDDLAAGFQLQDRKSLSTDMLFTFQREPGLH